MKTFPDAFKPRSNVMTTEFRRHPGVHPGWCSPNDIKPGGCPTGGSPFANPPGASRKLLKAPTFAKKGFPDRATLGLPSSSFLEVSCAGSYCRERLGW